MSIINRELSHSEQRQVFQVATGAISTNGTSGVICAVPWPASLDAAQIMAFGLSGAPSVQLVVDRFIPGTGHTAFNVGGALTVPAFGTSGVGAQATLGMSLQIIGSTLTSLLSGDVLMFQATGANTAVTDMVINVVLRPLSDIKKHYSVI